MQLVWFGLYFGNVHIVKFTFKNGHYPGELHLMEDIASVRLKKTNFGPFCGDTRGVSPTVSLGRTSLGPKLRHCHVVVEV